MQCTSKLALALATVFVAPALASAEIIHSATYEGHTYHLLAPASWFDSEAEAVTLGGHLVTINDVAEDNFVFSTFGPVVEATRPRANTSLWIGLNDVEAEGTFVWVNGEPATYLNWAPGQPQDLFPDEDFVGIFVGFLQRGRWHDIVSDNRFGDVAFGVVEVNSAVPEPSAILLMSVGGIALWLGARRLRCARRR